MAGFFAPRPPPAPEAEDSPPPDACPKTTDVFTGYFSDDDASSDDSNSDSDEEEDTPTASASASPAPSTAQFRIPTLPPWKQRRLDVPACVQRQQHRETRQRDFKEAFLAIRKLMQSRKTVFSGGQNSLHPLQERRARAIESALLMVVKRSMTLTAAFISAAGSYGFSPLWGSRMVRAWVRQFMKDHSLPESSVGCHAKIKSLLDDPILRAEIRSYLHLNKWAMDPGKC